MTVTVGPTNPPTAAQKLDFRNAFQLEGVRFDKAGLTILNRPWFANLSDFVVTGSQPTINAADGSISWPNFVDWESGFLQFYESNDPAVDIEAVIRINALTATGYGFCIAYSVTNSWFNSGSWGVQVTSFSHDPNDMKFWNRAIGAVDNTGTNGCTARKRLNGPNTGLSVGDIVKLVVMTRGNNLLIEVNNLTTGAKTPMVVPVGSPASVTRSGLGFPRVAPAMGRFKIGSFADAGAVSLMSLKVVSRSIQNPHLLVIGDSKTRGVNAGRTEQRFSEYLNALGPTATWAGNGDRTTDALRGLSAALATRPKNVLLCIGRNDVASGIPLATTQANYQSIVSQCQAAGASVFHLISPPESTSFDATLNTFNTWLKTTYGSAVLEAGVAQGFKYAWVTDGVHPNSIGCRFIAMHIINSGVIPAVQDYNGQQFNDFPGEYSLLNVRQYLGLSDYQSAAPSSGSTVQVGDMVGALWLDPASPLATLTIAMPTNPMDGQILHIGASQNISAVTITTSVGTVDASVSSMISAGIGIRLSSPIALKFCGGRWIAWCNRQ